MKMLLGALLIAVAAPALAAMPARPATDTARDAARKPDAMMTFAGIKPGAKVADFIPGSGYFTRVFAEAVGPTGHVIAIIPAAAEQHAPADAAAIRAMTGNGYPNVSVVASPLDPSITPGSLDVFWTAQNYHDLHNGLPPEQLAGLNKAIFASLKPGGMYVIVDHAAPAGSGLTDTSTLHRIDPASVKAEVTAAGFVFDSESTALANPADPRTANVFDPAIRGKTDQFVYRFRRP